jgi:hypothetical protein
MPPGEGSTPGNVVDGDVPPRRPRCRIPRRSIEKTNPGNLEFVCANLGIYNRVYICYIDMHMVFSCIAYLFLFYWDVAESSNSRIRSQTAGGTTTTTEPDVRLYSFLHYLLVLFMIN